MAVTTDQDQTTEEFQTLIRQIGEMCEEDVDACLADENRYPSGEGLTGPIKAACFRRLDDLQGSHR